MTEHGFIDHPLKGNRSFALRRGRMTNAQQAAYNLLLPYYLAPEGPVDFDALFGRKAQRIVEIGSGMGEATALIAEAHPEADFIAIEVFPPGIANLARLIQDRGLSNLRIVQADAVDVFAHRLSALALDGIHVFFPDPWPKKRHHKRRLIQPAFVTLLTTALKVNGYIHCATDWADYAEQMRTVLDNTEGLQRVLPEEMQRLSWRPVTKFEIRGVGKGHQIVDMMYRKTRE